MKTILCVLVAGLSLVSCVPSTPQARIQQSPQKFDALSAKHRALVQQGQITPGMSTDAVYLSWGRPSGVFQGSKKGRATERWDYTGSQPVYGTGFYGGYGLGYGYGRGPYGAYARYGNPAYYYGIGPEVAYVPYRIASVWFIDNRVDSWNGQDKSRLACLF